MGTATTEGDLAGWHRQQYDDGNRVLSQVASDVGSLGDDVNLGAGGRYTQTASNNVDVYHNLNGKRLSPKELQRGN